MKDFDEKKFDFIVEIFASSLKPNCNNNIRGRYNDFVIVTFTKASTVLLEWAVVSSYLSR